MHICIYLYREQIFNGFSKGTWETCAPSHLRLCSRKSKYLLLLRTPSKCFISRPLCLSCTVLSHYIIERLRLIVQQMSFWGYCWECFPLQHDVFFTNTHGRYSSWVSSSRKPVLIFCLQLVLFYLFIYLFITIKDSLLLITVFYPVYILAVGKPSQALELSIATDLMVCTWRSVCLLLLFLPYFPFIVSLTQ